MEKILMVDFIANVGKYLDTDEIMEAGCHTCDYGSQYGVNYEINIPETGEHYSFSTVEEYENNVFIIDSLKYTWNQTLENFIDNLEIVHKFYGRDRGYTRFFRPKLVQRRTQFITNRRNKVKSLPYQTRVR